MLKSIGDTGDYDDDAFKHRRRIFPSSSSLLFFLQSRRHLKLRKFSDVKPTSSLPLCLSLVLGGMASEIAASAPIAHSHPLPPILSAASASAGAASACPRTAAALSATAHSSSNAASALSAIAPAGLDAATTSTVTAAASASTVARRFFSAKSSASSTFVAGRAEAGSRSDSITPVITAGGQELLLGEWSGARERSRRRRAGRLAPEVKWNSAARKASRCRRQSWVAGPNERRPPSASVGGWWWWCSGKRHWVKLYDVDEEDDDKEEEGGGRSSSILGVGSEPEGGGDRGEVGGGEADGGGGGEGERGRVGHWCRSRVGRGAGAGAGVSWARPGWVFEI